MILLRILVIFSIIIRDPFASSGISAQLYDKRTYQRSNRLHQCCQCIRAFHCKKTGSLVSTLRMPPHVVPGTTTIAPTILLPIAHQSECHTDIAKKRCTNHAIS